MKVVSLVPSLTETLIESGVDVVGRTRYCIHPAECVADVAVVGGTKRVSWARVEALKPGLVIMDREENTREMAESCPLPWHATHITSIDTVGPELGQLADLVASADLKNLADGWQQLAAGPAAEFRGWDRLPGFISAVGDISGEFSRAEYLIWRDPWMGVGPSTFIFSMMQKAGFAGFLPRHTESYPQLPDDLPLDDIFYLFSSEPYPFERCIDELAEQGFRGALVDGEFYSWFGIRSYEQLKKYTKE